MTWSRCHPDDRLNDRSRLLVPYLIPLGPDPEGAITVKPGDTGELTSEFDSGGTTEIGCHEVGHYGLGMKVSVEVI